mgnify:CR=1 FL=1
MPVRTSKKKYNTTSAREIEDENDPQSYIYWMQPDNLVLLAGWARSGYSDGDIAQLMGVSISTYKRWFDKYPKIRKALKTSKEVVDFKVENALLKSALGYTTKESRVLIIMRHGKVVETQRETLAHEVAPQIGAIRMWLLNRQPDVWKNENKMSMDDLLEDSKVHISITRAKDGNLATTSESVSDKDIELRSATKDEQKEYIKQKKQETKAKQADSTPPRSKVSRKQVEEEDLDYWPEDWEDGD